MTDVETRLRDALATRGAAVAPTDPDTYAAIVRRRGGRRVRRLSVAGAVGLGVAGVAVAVAVTGPPRALPPTGPAAAERPAVAAGIRDGMVVFAETESFSWVATWSTSASERVLDVAPAGAGRFYAAVFSPATCRTTVFLVRVERSPRATGGWLASVEPGAGFTVRAHVGDLDVSPDGRRLAYVARPAAERAGRCTNDGEVRVRDLATGAERVWDDGRPPDAFPFEAALRWAPDGRLLSLGVDWEAVDTSAPVGTIVRRTAPWVVVGRGFCWETARAFTHGGDRVAMLDCSEAGLTSGVYVVDRETNSAQELLFTPTFPTAADSLDLDASGEHVLLKSAVQYGGAWTWHRAEGLRHVTDAVVSDASGWEW